MKILPFLVEMESLGHGTKDILGWRQENGISPASQLPSERQTGSLKDHPSVRGERLERMGYG